MTDFKVDYRNKRIVLTAQFAKRAEDPNNREANLKLKEVIEMYPTYDIMIRSIKKNPNKRTRKGFTIAFMETYITLYGTAEELLAFNRMKVLTKCFNNVDRFHALEDWFFLHFSSAEDIEDYEAAALENQLKLLECIDQAKPVQAA